MAFELKITGATLDELRANIVSLAVMQQLVPAETETEVEDTTTMTAPVTQVVPIPETVTHAEATEAVADVAAVTEEVPVIDIEGLPWDARIHVSTKTQTKKGTWTKKKKVPAETLQAVEAENRAKMQTHTAATMAPAEPAPVAAPIAPVEPAPLPVPSPDSVAQTATAPVAPVAAPVAPVAAPVTAPAAPVAAPAAGTVDFPTLSTYVNNMIKSGKISPQQFTDYLVANNIADFNALAGMPHMHTPIYEGAVAAWGLPQ